MITLVSFFMALSATPQIDLDFAGPYPVAVRDVQFTDANFGRGVIIGKVFYPATTAGVDQPLDVNGGPYPLVGFSHGWTEPVSDYASLLTHLASWGFVVAGIGTETDLWGDMQVEAKDLRSMLHWCEDESLSANSWLAQALDYQDWGAAGHSMGGASMGYLVRDEPRISDVVMLEPYHGSFLGSSYPAFNQFHNYNGRLMVVAGAADTTCPPSSMVKPWFDKATGTEKAVYMLIDGGGHFGATIWPGWNGNLNGPDQARMHFRLLSAFMLSGLKHQEDRWEAFCGMSAAVEPISAESASQVPAIWMDYDAAVPSELLVGIAGDSGMNARMAYSFNTGYRSTVYGTVEIDLATASIFIRARFAANGIEQEVINLPPTWSGTTLYLQGASIFARSGHVSRAASFLVP
jgi:pimeloyl-ACP methyl ester carboxylesterase